MAALDSLRKSEIVDSCLKYSKTIVYDCLRLSKLLLLYHSCFFKLTMIPIDRVDSCLRKIVDYGGIR